MSQNEIEEVIIPFDPVALKALDDDVRALIGKYRDTVAGQDMYSLFLRHAILMGGAMKIKKRVFTEVASQGWDYYNEKKQ